MPHDHDEGTTRRWAIAAHIAVPIAAPIAVPIAAPIAVPIAAAITAPTSRALFADDQCGDGSEWSKTGGRCIPAPTAAPNPPLGATFRWADGDYSSSKPSKGPCSRRGGIAATGRAVGPL